VINTTKSSARIRNSLEAIARNVGTAIKSTTLIQDMHEFIGAEKNIPSEPTLISYMDTLERLMILEPLPAWTPRMRSKVGLRQTSHLYFVDPSLAVVALKKKPDDLLKDLGALGFLFESLVVRDLRVFAGKLRGRTYFYGNYDDDEIDVIIDLGGQKWGAVEIKLNPIKSETAADNINRIIKKIDTDKVGSPAFKIVVTGYGNAKLIKDDVYQVPISFLGP
jgi:predicted AAA+ superfamily ATPase